jgi:hypothetical protein
MITFNSKIVTYAAIAMALYFFYQINLSRFKVSEPEIYHKDVYDTTSRYTYKLDTSKPKDEMNYFDERFLLHGEEDGDFVWRYIDKYGQYPPSISLPILSNLHQTGVQDLTMITSNTEIGYGNKPKFNQEFTVTKYEYDPNAKISGLYGRPHKRILGDERQYPYESFYFKNKENLKKFDKIIL